VGFWVVEFFVVVEEDVFWFEVFESVMWWG